jgi:hypothetical protein
MAWFTQSLAAGQYRHLGKPVKFAADFRDKKGWFRFAAVGRFLMSVVQ